MCYHALGGAVMIRFRLCIGDKHLECTMTHNVEQLRSSVGCVGGVHLECAMTTLGEAVMIRYRLCKRRVYGMRYDK